MEHQRSAFVVVLVSVYLGVVALAGVSLLAQGQPFAGSWQLNVSKSKYTPGPAPKSSVVKVEYIGDTRRSIVDSVTAAGQRTRVEYSAASDGKDYPIKGSPDADTVSLKRVDANTIERTDKRSGKVVITLLIRLSADGKTMTVTQKGTNAQGQRVDNTLVYEKQ